MNLRDAITIIGGSAVGGGFMAVPIITAPLGLLPSAASLLVVWVFLVLSALAYVEAAATVMSTCGREEGAGASVLAISKQCFGGRAAAVVSTLFVLQMCAIVAANLVKLAELLLLLVPGVPFACGVGVAAAAFGGFVFTASPQLIGLTNTVFTGSMCMGFLAVFAAAAVMAPAPARAGLLAHASWSKLLPQPGWVLPVFLNTLRFGESVPVVVGGMGVSRLQEVRTAVLAGSLMPLLLAVGLAAASSLLTSVAAPSALGAADPMLALLTTASPALAAPIALVALGAVGSTMIAVLLACSQLLSDTLRSRARGGGGGVAGGVGGDGAADVSEGRGSSSSSPSWLPAAKVALLALPAALACSGPGSYLKLLAFSGAFPTIVLYALLPPLAALELRRRGGLARRPHPDAAVPGGAAALATVVVVACALLATNAKLLVASTISAAR